MKETLESLMFKYKIKDFKIPNFDEIILDEV